MHFRCDCMRVLSFEHEHKTHITQSYSIFNNVESECWIAHLAHEYFINIKCNCDCDSHFLNNLNVMIWIQFHELSSHSWALFAWDFLFCEMEQFAIFWELSANTESERRRWECLRFFFHFLLSTSRIKNFPLYQSDILHRNQALKSSQENCEKKRKNPTNSTILLCNAHKYWQRDVES